MPPPQPATPADPWLDAFHAGQRACLEQCYRDHYETVNGSVGAILAGADRETLVHEIFFRLLTDESMRRGFGGGSFRAWLRVVARHQAIDHARRRHREIALDARSEAGQLRAIDESMERQADVRLTLERFRARVLPKKWEPVFVARFLEHKDQPTAARALGMRRSTLAYQEYRVRKLLSRFILQGERE